MNDTISYHIVHCRTDFLHTVKKTAMVADSHLSPDHRLSLYRRTCMYLAQTGLAIDFSRDDLVETSDRTNLMMLRIYCRLATEVQREFRHLGENASVREVDAFGGDLAYLIDRLVPCYENIFVRFHAMYQPRSP